MGYQRNEYDWRVMNKTVNEKQCTILFHVGGLNMSHFYPDIVYSFLSDIDAEYVKIAKITITRSKIHKYLRMTIEYSSPGKLIFYMVN